MFSYIAKSLVSKTLRTFLRTYLDDIELEGINWSSTTDQSTGNNARQGSGSTTSSAGWGVQLSNVKLREGMELVKLPGKRKRTVIVTKKVKRTKEDEPSLPITDDVAESQTPRASNKRKIKLDRKDQVALGGELPMLFNAPPQPPSIQDEDDGDIPTKNDNVVVTIDEKAIQQSYHRERALSEDYYSDAGYLSSNPPTPKQSRTFCGIPAAICRNNGKSSNNHAYNKAQQYSMDQVSSFDDDDQRSDGSRVVSFDQSSIDNNYDDDDGKYLDHPLSDLDTTDNDQDSYTEVEEECVVEEEMALVVGAGGVIGTLNIRVVDKELHITVEDAHLILEVIPKEEEDSEKKVNSQTKASKPASFDRSNSTSSDGELPSRTTSKRDEDTTIGNKVKQKSVFAKVLSMIPILFLRDVRVSLILPEEVDSSREGGGEDDESTNDSCGDCTVFELGIDFLSVTSGDDFMDVFQRNNADTPSPKAHRQENKSVSDEDPNANSKKSGQDSNYKYERKRIRTGKGPEGGLWLTIQRPNASDIVYGRKKRSNYKPHDEKKWARRRFLDSSQAFCFRCSGIDLHARIVIEKRRAVDEDLENALSDELEDYTLDSMLFGVDYIDPATFTRHANRQKRLIEKRTAMPISDKLVALEQNADSNDVESIPFSSNFHWIAQSCHRSGCPTSYLPLEECVQCWNTCQEKSTPTSSSSKSSMDTLMPLPGSIFALSITDPIEISVDRNHLDGIGYLLSMFTSSATKPSKRDDNNSRIQQEEDASTLHETSSHIVDCNSFPSYMQPDAIYISDIHIAKLTVRIHTLRPSPENDFGLKFGYWELNATSICCEDQHVDSDELNVHDMTFYIGSLNCVEYKGTCEHNIVAVGLPLKSRTGQNDIYIPSTASQILEVPSSSAFDATDSSLALHARLIYREGAKDGKQRKDQNGFLSLKTGTFNVEIDHSLIGSIASAVDEAKLTIIGDKGAAKTESNDSKIASSKSKANPLWLLQVATKGGNLSYQPLVKVKIPASRYQAKKNTSGFSLNTFLNGLGIDYGQSQLETRTPASLAPLSILPESLRLHVLLYLDDLAPLEKALKIKRKKKSSAFLRSHAISKKLSKLPQALRNSTSAEEETHRRNDLLSQLQSLDVESLEALLTIYDSFPKKTQG